MPSLIFFAAPPEASSLAARRSPRPSFAAEKIAVAPIVAATALRSVPGKRPKRNPPVSVAMAAPGKEKATIRT